MVEIGLQFVSQTADPTTTDEPIPDPNQAATTAPQVLGDQQELFIGKADNSYYQGGIMAYPSDEPSAIRLSAYGLSGQAQVTLFEANEELLLRALVSDEDGKQIYPQVDTSRLNQVSQIQAEINQRYHDDSGTATLPLEGSGIWYIQAKQGDTQVGSFIIRSNFGVTVHEADQGLLFWGQKFTDNRRIENGTVEVYSAKDRINRLSTAGFNNQGTAIAPADTLADIAIARHDQDIALIPINLQYLNYDWNYRSFQPKSLQHKYFMFTDRPIYRPGDTINFKAIIRRDDDARYSLPQGLFTVILEKDGQTVAEQNYPVSGQGTIQGSIDISAAAKTGIYYLHTHITNANDESNNYSDWNYRQELSVEEFRKPDYQVDITAQATEYVRGDQVIFDISGQYFSGQPLANQEVTYRVYSRSYYDSLWTRQRVLTQDYYMPAHSRGRSDQTGTVTLNQQGLGTLKFNSKTFKNDRDTQLVAVEIAYTDATGNQVTQTANILVYGAEYSIYRENNTYWPAKLGQAYNLPIILFSNNGGNTEGIALRGTVKRTWYEKREQPEKKYPDYIQHEEDLPEIVTRTDEQGRATLTTYPQEPGTYTITLEGNDGRGNTVRSIFSYWVRGTDSRIYSRRGTNSRLQIEMDKETYQHTDTALVSITGEVSQTDALLTIQNDQVRRHQLISLNQGKAEVSVPLQHDDMPNITFALTAFVGGNLEQTSQRVLINTDPQRLIVQLTPDKTTYAPGEQAVVQVKTIDINGTPISANTAVWLVDKALYQIVSDNLRNVFDRFWQERYSHSQSSHSLRGISIQSAEQGGGCFVAETPVLMADGSLKNIDQIKVGDEVLTRAAEQNQVLRSARVTEVEATQVDGYYILNGSLKVTGEHRVWTQQGWRTVDQLGFSDNLLQDDNRWVQLKSIEWQTDKTTVHNLEIDTYHTYFAGGVWVHNQKGGGLYSRDDFKDTAYWNPNVQTDGSGNASLRFNLPDNLTTWVLTSVGSTPDTKVGQTTTDITVAQDIVIRPVVPNLLRTGDETLISALVQNFTDQSQDFLTGFELDWASVEALQDQMVTVPAGGIQQLYWKVSTEVINPEAQLTFIAESQDDPTIGDSMTITIPVEAYGFQQHTGQVGINSAELTITPDTHADAKLSSYTLSFASSITGTLPEAMRYLVRYPYGCVEQTTSRFVPAVVAQMYPELFPQDMFKHDLDEVLHKGVKRLEQLQNDDGGWLWWHGETSDPFITAYVAEYLTRAQTLGTPVDPITYSKLTAYVQDQLKRNPDQETKIILTYASSYLFPGQSAELLETNAELPNDVLALAVMANSNHGYTNHLNNGAQILVDKAITKGQLVYWGQGSVSRFGNDNVSTALAIRALNQVGNQDEIVTRAIRYLIEQRDSYYWSNTFATAQIVHAAAQYNQTFETAANFNYQIRLDDELIHQGRVTNQKTELARLTLDFDQIAATGSRLSITKSDGPGILLSTLIQDELITDKQAQAINNYGLTIERRYINDKGHGYSMAVGDTLTVELKVTNAGTEQRYALTTDILPAGLVPINPRLKNSFSDKRSYWSWYAYGKMDIGKADIQISIDRLKPGTQTYSYKARVINQGTFAVAPATVHLMYQPEIYGRTSAESLTVGAESTYTEPINIDSPSTEHLTPLPNKISQLKQLKLKYRVAGVLVIGGIIALSMTVFLQHKRQKSKPNDTTNDSESKLDLE